MTVPSNMLLVTGSRSLADHPAAQTWAIRILDNLIARLSPVHGWIVRAGDAAGPDRWAIDRAKRYGVRWEQYCLDGMLRRATDAYPWHADPLNAAKDAGRRWPLVRNERMVTEAWVWQCAGGTGATVHVHAFRAPWARTDGTGHTVGIAREFELNVTEHVCPSEYGPQGPKP